MGILILLLFFFVPGIVLGCFAIFLIAEASRGITRPTRFYLSDMAWLMLLLQYPLVFLSYARSWQSEMAILSLGSLLLIMCLFVWWRGITTLSGLNVIGPWRRGTFLLVILPGAIFTGIFGGPMLAMLFEQLRRCAREETVTSELILPTGLAALFIGLSFGCRRLSYWILAGRQPEEENA